MQCSKLGLINITSILLCFGFLTASSLAQQAGSTSPLVQVDALTATFAGCYELKLGRWWPWSYGEDAEYVTLPRFVRLLAVRGTEGFEKEGFLIRRVPPHGQRVSSGGEPAYWLVKGNNRVDLVWTDGFTGVVLDLSKSKEGLRGWAHPHFDFPHFVPRIAHVTARRISCEGAR